MLCLRSEGNKSFCYLGPGGAFLSWFSLEHSAKMQGYILSCSKLFYPNFLLRLRALGLILKSPVTLKSGGLCSSALGSETHLLFLFKPPLGDPIPPDAQGSAQPFELKKSLH